MITIAWLALTFSCGAAYEFGCAMWVRFAERRQPMRAVVWSCFNCLVTVVGLGEALHRPAFIAVYVAGFGFGTWLAVRPAPQPEPSGDEAWVNTGNASIDAAYAAGKAEGAGEEREAFLEGLTCDESETGCSHTICSDVLAIARRGSEGT